MYAAPRTRVRRLRAQWFSYGRLPPATPMLQHLDSLITSASALRLSLRFRSARALRLPLICLPLLGLAGACGTPDDEESNHALSNKGFLLTIETSNWTKPPMAEQISDYIPQFVVKFGEGSASSMPYVLASSKNGAQDPCGPTVSGTTTVEPFGLGPVEFPLHLVHPDTTKNLTANTTVHGFTLTDVIPDGATLAQGSLTANVDIRQVYKLFTMIGIGGQSPDNPEVVCNQFQAEADQAGTTCGPCSDGQPYCLPLQADFLSATETPMAIGPIGVEVLTTNPSCAATP